MNAREPYTRHNSRYPAGTRNPETTEERIKRAARKPGGYQWPELRIGRRFDMHHSAEWDVFLNALGGNNQRKGHARVAGELACHLVSDKEMRNMLQNKYDLETPEKAEAVYTRVRNRLFGFIRSEQAFYGPRNNGRLVESDVSYQTQLPQEFYNSPHYAPTELAVKGVHRDGLYGYDGNKYGVDLSENDFLVDERNGLLRYLRRDEGLDTSLVRNDWEPHATIFELHSHLRIQEVAPRIPRGATMPRAMQVLSVAAISDQ